jgi:hypothetical protein
MPETFKRKSALVVNRGANKNSFAEKEHLKNLASL